LAESTASWSNMKIDFANACRYGALRLATGKGDGFRKCFGVRGLISLKFNSRGFPFFIEIVFSFITNRNDLEKTLIYLPCRRLFSCGENSSQDLPQEGNILETLNFLHWKIPYRWVQAEEIINLAFGLRLSDLSPEPKKGPLLLNEVNQSLAWSIWIHLNLLDSTVWQKERGQMESGNISQVSISHQFRNSSHSPAMRGSAFQSIRSKGLWIWNSLQRYWWESDMDDEMPHEPWADR